MISAEQFAEWKTHPVTQEIFAEIEQVKKDLTDKLKQGNTIGDTAEKTHGMTNRMIGHIEGLDQLLGISYAQEDVIEDVSMLSGY